jgi:hypothetical protein
MIKFIDGYGNTTRQAETQNNVNKFLPFKENEKSYQVNNDDLVNNKDYDEPGELAKEKARLIKAVNEKTDILLSQGADFEGDIVSTSIEWSGFEKRIEKGKTTLPATITAKSGKPIEINETNKNSFFDTIDDRFFEIKTTEGALKAQIYSAPDFDTLKLFEDNRE